MQKGNLSPKPCSQHFTNVAKNFFSGPFQKQNFPLAMPQLGMVIYARETWLSCSKSWREQQQPESQYPCCFPQIVTFLGHLGGSSWALPYCWTQSGFHNQKGKSPKDEFKRCRICAERETETSPMSFAMSKVSFKKKGEHWEINVQFAPSAHWGRAWPGVCLCHTPISGTVRAVKLNSVIQKAWPRCESPVKRDLPQTDLICAWFIWFFLKLSQQTQWCSI